ncbi:alpha amylase C-terminal domain-containing protein [Rhizobium phaseoli]|uniref:alpha amylase C-terminal domain-containing protein n=1 Tax=Rhizobium phaseoli TaxID=396 RepID=UPI001F018C9E|nr:alpha amylase C-terminal domain-containing protein [Rhizobium phaseoli]
MVRPPAATRSRNIPLVHDENRSSPFIAGTTAKSFSSWDHLNDAPFDDGYWLHSEWLGDGLWQEVFNTDVDQYGGRNIGNRGEKIRATTGALNAVLPASGVLVFRTL